MDIASDGNPLCVRALVDSFRKAVRATTEVMPSAKIKLVLKDICNKANVVEYLILKKRDEEPVQEFTPSKRRQDQPPQTMDGMFLLATGSCTTTRTRLHGSMG